MKVYEVQCPTCCGSFHKTTAKFDKLIPANGINVPAETAVRQGGMGDLRGDNSTICQKGGGLAYKNVAKS